MEQPLEQRFDALVGRLVTWLGGDPLRTLARLSTERAGAKKTATAADPEADRPAPKKAAAAAKKPPASRVRTRRTPAKKRRAQPAPDEPAPIDGVLVETPKQDTAGELDDAEKRALQVLTALGGTASVKELGKETGETPYVLTTRLKKLQEAGLVKRVGAGLKTRYQKT